MTKSFNKLKKPCFWPIFGPLAQILGKKIFFPENPDLSHITYIRVIAPCKNSEKTNAKISRKRLVRRTDRKTDRPYFVLTLPATAGGPKIVSSLP